MNKPAGPKSAVLKVPITAVQGGWLKAMGVDVPWIVVEQPTHTRAAAGASAADSASSHTATQATTHTAATVTANTVDLKVRSTENAHQQPVDSAAHIAHVAGLSLDALGDQIRQCQQCGLCKGRRHAVVGTGPVKPSVLVVGEAPGPEEDAEGQPFVGLAGQLLDNMLGAIGLDRTQSVYITNVVKCRPPGNRNPQDDEIATCGLYLQRQIELLEPRVILALGRFAAQTLLKTELLVPQFREQTWHLTLKQRDIPVVVTYHLAHLLTRAVDKRLAWEDLKRVHALLG